MTERPKLTEDELALLATLTLAAQAEVGFTFDDPAVREVADGLIESGHLEAIEGVEASYRLSPEMAGALALSSAMQAEGAVLN